MAGNEIDLRAQNNSPVDAQNSIRGSFSRITHYSFTNTLFKIQIPGSRGGRWVH